MFGIFHKRRLIKKGMATSKARRRCSESEWQQTLEASIGPKIAILVAFAIGLGALIFSGYSSQPTQPFVIALLIFLTAIGQLWISHPATFANNSRLFLLLATIMTQLILAKLVQTFGQHGTLFGVQYVALFIPYAFAALVISVLMGKNLGVYAGLFVSLWQAIVISADATNTNAAILIVMGLISSFIAVFVTLEVRRRSRFIRAGIFVGLATLLLAIAFQQIFIPFGIGAIDWFNVGKQCAAAVFTGISTAIVVSGLLPMLEAIFKITTDISWLELSDLNHPLLKRMTLEAPGTYHHSLVVANLAEAAAETVGANPTICRVCAYFHDIGKLVKPDYFTENMAQDRNPHDDLAPTMSALIIIAHVKEGVDLALKHNLNKRIIDVIQQHHGTSLVYYFYKRALQQQEDARQGGKVMNIREEDIPTVSAENFRYPGPIAQSREAAIVGMADCVESASRSIERPTPQKIEQLVNDILKKRYLEGQLDECDLTFSDLHKLSESFQRTLNSMLHRRVAYPSENPAKDSANEQRSVNPSKITAA